MTRSTNMEHVEVLRDLSEICRAAIKAGDWKVDGACDPDAVLRRADAAIASLSAQPPAETQPVAWQFQDREGNWHGFVNEQHRLNTIEDGSWPIRPLYAHPPPSAPVGDSLLQTALRNLPQYISKSGLVGPDKHSAMQCFEALRDALAQQPAAVGEADKLDAKRYRFLRDNNGVRNHHGVEVYINGEAHAPGHLDAQVDAALAAQQGGA